MQELTYIAANGSQYFDTGVAGNTADLEIEIKYWPTAGLNESPVFGAAWSESGYFLMLYRSSWRFHSGGRAVDDGTVDQTDYSVVHTSRSALTVNGSSYPFTGGTDNSGNVLMFYLPYQGGRYGSGRLAYMKIWSGETLIRDYIPALDDNDRPCMYDTLSETAVYNSGSGEFTPGAVVPPTPPPPPPGGDLEIVLQYSASENNRVDKDLTEIATYTGTLRQSTSIIDPVFVIECDLSDVVGANYLTVDAFDRSYFIKNITSHRAGLVEFVCHVDVLSSFKTQLRTNRAIVHRSENNWNLYLNDGSLNIKQYPAITTQEFDGTFDDHFSYILVLAG